MADLRFQTGLMRRDLSALAGTEFDVVVVGGGICGAAAAWDAAERGLAVALVERGDFCGATSAESLKVVHGGIRYLQHLDVPRVRESARERATLLRIAPHLVHPLPIAVPTFGHGLQGAPLLHAGFSLLGALTADRNRRISDPARHIPAARLVSRRQILEWHPELADARLTGAGVFWDGQLDNPPRLVWAFVRSAARAGAVVANYLEVSSLRQVGGRVAGVRVEDRLGGERFDIRARVVLNAAGPYAEALLARTGVQPGRRISLSRDMALVVRRTMTGRTGLALQTRHRDPDAFLSRGNRHIFLLPWRDRMLVGVYSVIWRDDPDRLTVGEQDVSTFLDEINEAAPHLKLTPDDIAVVMAGLLPIAHGELKHRDVSFGKRPLVVDHAREGLPGLVSAVTNRYTVARSVAEEAVDAVCLHLGRPAPPCRTASLPIAGGDITTFDALVGEVTAALPNEPRVAERLAHDHGSAYRDVLRIAAEQPQWGHPLGAADLLTADIVHAVRHELALRLSDVVFRRTGLGTAGHPGEAALERAAALAGAELGWSAQRRATELADVRERLGRWGATAPRG